MRLCVVCLLRDVVWFVFCVFLCVLASVIMWLCVVVCNLLCDGIIRAGGVLFVHVCACVCLF